jgi:hypothetical protein
MKGLFDTGSFCSITMEKYVKNIRVKRWNRIYSEHEEQKFSLRRFPVFGEHENICIDYHIADV